MASVTMANLPACRFEASKGIFKGDDERLLERMIEACQSRPSVRLPGYGRQLVPFFSDPCDKGTQPLEYRSRAAKRGDSSKPDSRRHNKKKSPRKNMSSSRDSCSPGSRAGATSRCVSSQEPSPVYTDGSKGKSEIRHIKEKAVSTEVGLQGAARVGHFMQRSHGKQRCGASYNNKGYVKDTTFAGPGYFLSPPPEDLPMPTAFLLSRAMSVSY